MFPFFEKLALFAFVKFEFTGQIVDGLSEARKPEAERT